MYNLKQITPISNRAILDNFPHKICPTRGYSKMLSKYTKLFKITLHENRKLLLGTVLITRRSPCKYILLQEQVSTYRSTLYIT